MTWTPRHEAHAIDQVALALHFSEPMPSKILTRSTSAILERAKEMGFDSTMPADSTVLTIRIDSDRAVPGEQPRNGQMMVRHVDKSVVEEVRFQDLMFAYRTKNYVRWENMQNRVNEVLMPALEYTQGVVDINSISLEYWDSFSFDGDPDQADAKEILEVLDPSIPEGPVSGEATWHSHVGWFERHRLSEGQEVAVLINRNINALNAGEKDGQAARRVLGIHTVAVGKGLIPSENKVSIDEVLEHVHKRAVFSFGQVIKIKYRHMIGLDLELYR